MSRPAAAIILTCDEQETLETWSRPGRSEPRFRQRARMILLAAEGRSTESIAQALNTRPTRVSQWRTRFARQRLAGLEDKPRPGRAETLRYDRGITKESSPKSMNHRPKDGAFGLDL